MATRIFRDPEGRGFYQRIVPLGQFPRARRSSAALMPLRLGCRTQTASSTALTAGFFGVGNHTGAAQLVIPLPFIPVPITGQTFSVLLVGGSMVPRAER